LAEAVPNDESRATQADRMTGKVCVVTGGGSGICRAAALKMAAEGAAAVLVAGRREAEIETTAAACRALGAQALAVPTDVTQEDDVARLVSAAIERFGRLDVAFNNAGFQERRAQLEQQASSVYDAVFDANVRSIFLCLRHQLPVMFARGEGRIVVNASVSGIRNPYTGLALYSASKAAAIAMMRSAALKGRAPRRADQRDCPGPCRHRHDAALGRRRHGGGRGGPAAAADGAAR
jgi:NAD(P)-dependent dehydrogenase (short-subunit alcohol dehydrogenase family)